MMAGTRAWSWATVGSLIEPIDTWNPPIEAPDELLSYIDIGAIDQQSKRIVDPKLIVGRDAPSRARQLVKAGDVLVSTVRPNLNSVARVPESLDGATASTGFCVLRPQKGRLDGGYLFQWVKSPLFVADMVRKATGANYPAVTDRIIHQSSLPHPPLAEQRWIAEVLDRADGLVSLRRTTLARTETLGLSMLNEMFSRGIRQNDYRTAPLAEVADVVSGVTKGRRLTDQTPVEVPYLRVANVQAGFLDLSEVKTIPALPQEVEALRLLAGDVVLTEGGDYDKLGRGAIWEGEIADCIHQNHVFRVRVDRQHLLPQYFNYFLQTDVARRYFLTCAKRTTNLASINMTQLKALNVPLPPLSLQQEFARRVAAIEKLKSAHRASLVQLEALFASLQHRAFRGEL